MEYVMIGTGMAVAITCILILEMIEYRRIYPMRKQDVKKRVGL